MFKGFNNTKMAREKKAEDLTGFEPTTSFLVHVVNHQAMCIITLQGKEFELVCNAKLQTKGKRNNEGSYKRSSGCV